MFFLMHILFRVLQSCIAATTATTTYLQLKQLPLEVKKLTFFTGHKFLQFSSGTQFITEWLLKPCISLKKDLLSCLTGIFPMQACMHFPAATQAPWPAAVRMCPAAHRKGHKWTQTSCSAAKTRILLPHIAGDFLRWQEQGGDIVKSQSQPRVTSVTSKKTPNSSGCEEEQYPPNFSHF